jgi:hypothetical protein
MMGKQIRKLLLSLSILAFVGAWTGVAIVYAGDYSVTAFTIAVTIAAFATEALIWALAFIAGWSVFANRKAVWARFFGRKPEVTS